MPNPEAFPELRLKPREDRRLSAGHLWVFSNEVDTARTPLTGFEPGSLCRVVSDRDKFLGYAYVNPASLISARILGRDAQHPPSKSLLVHRLQVASSLRRALYEQPFYRLAYGESDGLPGLVLDRFGDVVVGQIATAGMEAMKGEIQEAVKKVVNPQALDLEERQRRARSRELAALCRNGLRRTAGHGDGRGGRRELSGAA